MGTRGFITFSADGTNKTTYNHWDSYPDGLGTTVLAWARETTEAGEWPKVRQQVLALKMVDEDQPPTAEEIDQIGEYAAQPGWHGAPVAYREGQQWYDLLRDLQGNPRAILDCGFAPDAGDFPSDSLFAEWGYVIDLDGDGWFEVYKGFQTAEHDKGRFAKSFQPKDYREGSVGQYYPVALVQRWGLSELPTAEEFAGIKWYDDEEE